MRGTKPTPHNLTPSAELLLVLICKHATATGHNSVRVAESGDVVCAVCDEIIVKVEED